MTIKAEFEIQFLFIRKISLKYRNLKFYCNFGETKAQVKNAPRKIPSILPFRNNIKNI